MDSHHDFTDQLDALTDALGDPGTDLSAVLAVLDDDLRAAIPSKLALTISITLAGATITLTSAGTDGPAAAAASLRVPLDELTAANPGSTATFLAARPGAFVDLAADIRHACRLNGQVVIDGHLDHPGARRPGGPVIAGLIEFCLINRAIGVLIGQGHNPDTARSMLQHHADQPGTTLPAAAHQLLQRAADVGLASEPLCQADFDTQEWFMASAVDQPGDPQVPTPQRLSAKPGT